MNREAVKAALEERLELLEQMKACFSSFFGTPARVRRGEAQAAILDALDLPRTVLHRQLVTEALAALGYGRVKTQGLHFYRRRV